MHRTLFLLFNLIIITCKTITLVKNVIIYENPFCYENPSYCILYENSMYDSDKQYNTALHYTHNSDRTAQDCYSNKRMLLYIVLYAELS